MKADIAAYLWDATTAATKARSIAEDLTRSEYLDDWIRQSAVERQLEIIGEALNRVRKSDSETARRIPHINAIIATRNVIVHRYDDVDHIRVWAMLEDDIPLLIPILEALLAECD
ncbi:MAG: HepT-like ribonuclease domain-containing protein [Ancrocorticia sp.]